MTVLAVLMGLVQIVSVAMLILIAYEYRRVLRKRRTMWTEISDGHHATRMNRAALVFYTLFTLLLAGLGAAIIIRVP